MHFHMNLSSECPSLRNEHHIKCNFFQRDSLILSSRPEIYLTQGRSRKLQCYNHETRLITKIFQDLKKTCSLQKSRAEEYVLAGVQFRGIFIISTESKEILKDFLIEESSIKSLQISRKNGFLLCVLKRSQIWRFYLHKNERQMIVNNTNLSQASETLALSQSGNFLISIVSPLNLGLLSFQREARIRFYSQDLTEFSTFCELKRDKYCFLGTYSKSLCVMNLATFKCVKSRFGNLPKTFFSIVEYENKILIGTDTNILRIRRSTWPFESIKKFYLSSHRNLIKIGGGVFMVHGANKNGISVYKMSQLDDTYFQYPSENSRSLKMWTV